jgi:hypothetical protein
VFCQNFSKFKRQSKFSLCRAQNRAQNQHKNEYQKRQAQYLLVRNHSKEKYGYNSKSHCLHHGKKEAIRTPTQGGNRQQKMRPPAESGVVASASTTKEPMNAPKQQSSSATNDGLHPNMKVNVIGETVVILLSRDEHVRFQEQYQESRRDTDMSNDSKTSSDYCAINRTVVQQPYP